MQTDSMFIKQNFRTNGTQKVRFVKCDELTGLTGFVVGKSASHVVDFYMVQMDKPLSDREDKVVNIIETCLERVE
jgi:hypothetical protein